MALNDFLAGVTSTDTTMAEPLLTGSQELVSGSGTIAAGQTLPELSVLGRVTASGEYKLAATASADGSQVPVAILVHGVDTTGGAISAPVYLAGTFNPVRLNWGTGFTAGAVRNRAFDGTDIHLRTAV